MQRDEVGVLERFAAATGNAASETNAFTREALSARAKETVRTDDSGLVVAAPSSFTRSAQYATR